MNPTEGAYRPHLRTALVLTGVGTAGAYQAGVLRALQEAGIKIDVIAAHGAGIGTALMMAVDSGPGLWEKGGVWRDSRVRRLYRLKPSLRGVLWVSLVGCAVVVLPLAAMAAGLLAYPAGFLVGLVWPAGGQALSQTYAGLVERAYQSGLMPTLVSRLALLTIALAVMIVGGAAAKETLSRGDRRRDRGPWWARVVGTPWSARQTVEMFQEALWKGLRGAARVKPPPAGELSRRYVDVLEENFGQPGFRELLLLAHDVDARRDMIFALLADPFRREFLRQGPGGTRRRDGEILDLRGSGRAHVLDALAAGASLPVLTAGHPMSFAVDGFWRGETHVLSDRVGAVARLLDESAAAGARQVVIVSAASAQDRPHWLGPRRQTLRARAGEYFAGSELAALQDALAPRQHLFEGIFHIAPLHSPMGPFDFRGCRDDRSDRTYPLTELIDRGHEDAYQQFIEPVVGGSGERLQASR